MVGLLVAVDDAALLEKPEWCRRVEELAEAVWHWTGNWVAVTDCRAADLLREATAQRSGDGHETTCCGAPVAAPPGD